MNYLMRIEKWIMCCLTIVLSTSSCKEGKSPTNTINLDSLEGRLPALLSKMQNGDSVKIACYGNSITYGVSVSKGTQVNHPYPKKLQNLLRSNFKNDNINVLNRGNSGWTAEMGKNDLNSQVLAEEVDFVIIMFGINDYFQGYSVESFKKNISSMCDSFRNAGVDVMLMSPTPLADPDNNDELLHFCIAMKDVAVEQDVAFLNIHFQIVDWLVRKAVNPDLFFPDEIHFADAQYQVIAKELMEYVDSLE